MINDYERYTLSSNCDNKVDTIYVEVRQGGEAAVGVCICIILLLYHCSIDITTIKHTLLSSLSIALASMVVVSNH